MEESNEKINAENEEIVEPSDELQEDLLLEDANSEDFDDDKFDDDEPTSKKRQLIIIGVIFGILILAIAGWWLWTKNASNTADTATEPDVVVSVSSG